MRECGAPASVVLRNRLCFCNFLEATLSRQSPLIPKLLYSYHSQGVATNEGLMLDLVEVRALVGERDRGGAVLSGKVSFREYHKATV